jgi:hypothetical protein
MPFSDDEVIIVPHTRKRNLVLIISISLFVLSLCFTAYYTKNASPLGLTPLVCGWYALALVGSGICWMANPILMFAWILIFKQKRLAWLFALLSFLAAASFLGFDTVLVNEAGTHEPIEMFGPGYWLWLASCFAATVGALVLRFSPDKKY